MEKTINFCGGGLMGDFINQLSVCKNICVRENAKANLYISDGFGADPFRFGVDKAYEDIKDLILEQPYINKFEVLKYFDDTFINLNIWRNEVRETYNKMGGYNKCWSELLSQTFTYKIGEYKWLKTLNKHDFAKDRILIHRSLHRHNPNIKSVIDNLEERPVFITSNIEEFKNYEFKDKCDLILVQTITQLAMAINSCKLFIGNQSSPLTLASALDVNRIIELDKLDAPFYIGEKKYSQNIKFVMP